MESLFAVAPRRRVRSTRVLWSSATLALALLLVWAAPAAHAADNDDFVTAEVITGPSGSRQHHNSGATLEVGEPTETESGPNTIDATVWYSWTAPGTGPVTFTTCNPGTGGDTTLGAYTGTAVDSLTTVEVNNDMGACADSVAASLASEVSFTALNGTTYYIQVGDGPQATVVDFQLTWTGDLITKDDCKNGGWAALGFSNQGRCIQFVNTGRDSR